MSVNVSEPRAPELLSCGHKVSVAMVLPGNVPPAAAAAVCVYSSQPKQT